MNWFVKNWQKVPRAVRKPVVFVAGLAVVTAGLLLLVLPGPGWAAIFLGFAILATEFAFAEKVRDRLAGLLKQLLSRIKRRFKKPGKHKP